MSIANTTNSISHPAIDGELEHGTETLTGYKYKGDDVYSIKLTGTTSASSLNVIYPSANFATLVRIVQFDLGARNGLHNGMTAISNSFEVTMISGELRIQNVRGGFLSTDFECVIWYTK